MVGASDAFSVQIVKLTKQKDDPPLHRLMGKVDEYSSRKRTVHRVFQQPHLGGWGNPPRRKVGFKWRLWSIGLVISCVSDEVMSLLYIYCLFPLFWKCLFKSLAWFCIGLYDVFLMGLLGIIYIYSTYKLFACGIFL